MKKILVGMLALSALVFASCSNPSSSGDSGSSNSSASSTKDLTVINFNVEIGDVEGKTGITFNCKDSITDYERMQYLIEPEDETELAGVTYISSITKDTPTVYTYPFVEAGKTYTVYLWFRTKDGKEKFTAKKKITPKTGAGSVKVDANCNPNYDTATNIFTCNVPTAEGIPTDGSFYMNAALGTNWDESKGTIYSSTVTPVAGKITADFNKVISLENKAKMVGQDCFTEITYTFKKDGVEHHIAIFKKRFYTFKPTTEPTSLETDRLVVKNGAKGVDVTIRLPEGEKLISTWGSLTEQTTGIYLNFNNSSYITIDGKTSKSGDYLNENRSITINFPFAKKDTTYSFKLSGQYGQNTYAGDEVKIKATSDGAYPGWTFAKLKDSKTTVKYNPDSKSFTVSTNYTNDAFTADAPGATTDDVRIYFMLVYGKLPWVDGTEWLAGKDMKYSEYTGPISLDPKNVDEEKLSTKGYSVLTNLKAVINGFEWASADNCTDVIKYTKETAPANTSELDLTGSWVCSAKQSMQGATVTMKTTITLNANKTFVMKAECVEYPAYSTQESGTYEVKNGKIVITVEGESAEMSYTVVDSTHVTITGTVNGQTSSQTYAKQ